MDVIDTPEPVRLLAPVFAEINDFLASCVETLVAAVKRINDMGVEVDGDGDLAQSFRNLVAVVAHDTDVQGEG